MLDFTVNNVSKLTIVLIVAVIAKWLGTMITETIVKRNVGSFTVLLLGNLMLLFTCLLLVMFFPPLRYEVVKGIPMMRLGDWIRFGLMTILFAGLTLIVNVALQQHTASTLRIIELLASLVIGGLIYFATTSDRLSITKVIAFVIMSMSAVFFYNT